MSAIYPFLLCTIFMINSVLSGSTSSPCKKDDWDCLENYLNEVIPSVLVGIPSLGIEPSDPLYVNEIIGNLSTVQYVLTDVTCKGFSKCTLRNVRGDLNTLKFHTELFCPAFEITSKYEISGHLFDLPIEGKGDFFSTTKEYRSDIEGGLKKTESNGKTYIEINTIKLKSEPLGPVTFKYTNLFNGQKDLSDAVHKFSNENWKATSELLQDPVWYGYMKKIIYNVNKFLKTMPVDQIMSN